MSHPERTFITVSFSLFHVLYIQKNTLELLFMSSGMLYSLYNTSSKNNEWSIRIKCTMTWPFRIISQNEKDIQYLNYSNWSEPATQCRNSGSSVRYVFFFFQKPKTYIHGDCGLFQDRIININYWRTTCQDYNWRKRS